MDEKYYKGFEPFFGAWKIERLIGEGSYGKVFEISRSEFGITYRAAMKAISIPQKETESDALMLDSGMSHEQVTSYYYGCVEQLSREIDLMARLKGNSYIVSYEDHKSFRIQMALVGTFLCGWNCSPHCKNTSATMRLLHKRIP